MGEAEGPRTRLGQLLRQRYMTTDDLRKRYAEASGAELSERQAYRWVAGELRSLPHPHSCRALERIFGEPVARLLGPPYGTGQIRPARTPTDPGAPRRGEDLDDWQGQMLSTSASRAREFLQRTEVSHVGTETLDQLGDDIRRLVIATQIDPLPGLLPDMADAQRRAFELLEGRQRPEQARDLYLLAGVASGLMAKASHDLDALAWAGAAEAEHTEVLATEALDGYAAAPKNDRAYGDEAGARCALASARIAHGEIDGAAEAIAPVLELSPSQRIHGVVTSVKHVRRAVAALPSPGRTGAELADQLHVFATERLALTR